MHSLNVLLQCSTFHYILCVYFGLYNLDITTVFTAVSHAALFSATLKRQNSMFQPRPFGIG